MCTVNFQETRPVPTNYRGLGQHCKLSIGVRGGAEHFFYILSALCSFIDNIIEFSVKVSDYRRDVRLKNTQLEMWANAQRDGRPAEYRWRPLFNAAKFG